MSDAEPVPSGTSGKDRKPEGGSTSFEVGYTGTLEIAIGICAYNEGQTVERSIRSIYSQKTPGIEVREVVVVSSGSTDDTDDIVRGLAEEYDNLKFIRQEKREGKNSAINLYLDNVTCKIVVMLNADNIFASEDSLYHLVQPFRDTKVGMVGGHPIPTNDPKTLVGFASHMLWTMHHNLALIYPKIGELVAFRDIGTRLPTDLQSDEDIIRMRLEESGYRCIYAPEATIYNRGPETEKDFLQQRIRVNIGEVKMKELYGYDIPSWNKWYLAKTLLGTVKDLGFHPVKMLYMIQLEEKARRIAKKHVREGGDNMSVWEPVKSTKKV